MRRFMLRSCLSIAALVGIASLSAAEAQTALPSTALITLASQGAGTVVSGQLLMPINGVGISCTFNQTSHTGTPSTTFGIQQYDPGTGTFFSLLTSGAITADTTPTVLTIYPSMTTSGLPSNMTGLSLRMPGIFQITTTVGGTTPVVNAKIGCISLAPASNRQ